MVLYIFLAAILIAQLFIVVYLIESLRSTRQLNNLICELYNKAYSEMKAFYENDLAEFLERHYAMNENLNEVRKVARLFRGWFLPDEETIKQKRLEDYIDATHPHSPNSRN